MDKRKIKLDKTLFWDVDDKDLDLEKHKRLAIGKGAEIWGYR